MAIPFWLCIIEILGWLTSSLGLQNGPKRGYYPCEIDHQNEWCFPIMGSIEVRNWGLVFQKTYGLLRNWGLKNGHFCLSPAQLS